MPKTRRILGGALLTAAATALTVKGALGSPIGAAVPTDELRRDLTLAQQRLAAAIVPVPPGAPAVAPTSNGQVAPAEAKIPEKPESSVRGSNARLSPLRILRDAALRHQLDPKLVLAVSYWESGWDQSRVSETGAVGLMQVQPATAQEAGPALLSRSVDITDPYDNADVGAAVLKQNIAAFGDVPMALAAYYQGPTSLRANGMFADTRQYVQGILNLAARMTP
jgi:soluble lytic murein transglycosylase-like protein